MNRKGTTMQKQDSICGRNKIQKQRTIGKSIMAFWMMMCLLTVSGFCQVATVHAEGGKPSVKAHAYMVMDAHAGKKLYAAKANKKIYPASTVKVMTAVVALDCLSKNKKITFTKGMRKQVTSADIAHLGLKVGAAYSVNVYLHMMLMCSDADSAVALAVGAAGSTKAFVKKMNQKAEQLGMKATSFDNPIGLDKGSGYYKTYTTAKDFTVLARYAMSYETIRDIVAKNTYKVPKTSKSKSFTIHNTNAFYSKMSYDNSSYQVIGLKTGTTRAAGHVLIAVAKDAQGHEVICSFFGKSTDTRKYQDIAKLFSYTFAQYKKGKITLTKGFWDTRFRDSETVLQKYAENDLLENEEGRFYPDEVISQQEFAEWANAIAKTNLQTESEEDLTVQDLAQLLFGNDTSQLEQSVVDEWMQKLKNVPEDAEARMAIAKLYEKGIVESDKIADVNYSFTRENALVMIDFLQNKLVENSTKQAESAAENTESDPAALSVLLDLDCKIVL